MTDPVWQTAELEQLLARALSSADQPRSPRAVADALSRADGDPVVAFEALRVPVDVFERAPASLERRIGPGSPVLVETDAGWFVLIESRGGQALLVGPDGSDGDWIRWSDLHEHGRRWLLLSPAPLLSPSKESVPPLRRLRRFVNLEGQDLVTVLLYACGIGLLSLATPVAVQALVNTVSFGTALQPLVVLSLLLAAGLTFSAGLQLLQTWVVEMLRRRTFVRLVSHVADRLPRVYVPALHGGRGPEMVNRYFDIFTFEKALSTLLGEGVGVVVSAFVGLAILAVYHPYLLVFDMFIGAAVVGIVLLLGRTGPKTAIKESKAKFALAAWLQEVARHPIAFKAAGAGDLARSRADVLARDFLAARASHFKVVFRQIAGALTLQVVATAGLLGIGGWLVIARQLTLGQLVAAELIVAGTVASLAKSGKLLEAWYDALAAIDKLGTLVDLPVEEAEGEPLPLPEGPLAAQIHHADRSLDLAPGERVGITGPAGVDLTSYLGVLYGSGQHPGSIGGVRLDDLDRRTLRSRVELVREAEIVEGTVLDNLRFGRRGPNRAEAWTLLAQVGLADAIGNLPGGLDARLTPEGWPLDSTGVRRLALARALAAEPGLLLIDRALDALSSDGCPALEAVFGDERTHTALVVSSDPRVLARCDRVVELPARAGEAA